MAPASRKVLLVAAALFASLLSFAVASPPAQALPLGTITVMAQGVKSPTDITTGPDGNLWFTTRSDAIGRMTPAGVVTMFRSPKVAQPLGIAAGPDGNLWFTNTYNDTIGRITTAGVISTFTDAGISYPRGIVAGPDGNMWFTNYSSIGRITTAGAVSTFNGTGILGAVGIASGPDGNLWFTNEGNNSIGRITTAGIVSNFTHVSIGQPQGISAGPDGKLWFTNNGKDSIGRITTAGVVTSSSGVGVARPVDIVAGPDGSMWFTNQYNDTIGRITTAGAVSNFNDPSVSLPGAITSGPGGALWYTNVDSIGRASTSGLIAAYGPGINSPEGIAAGPDGNLWFTNRGNSSIGRITPAGAVSNFTGPGISAPQGIAMGPDGNVWFTNQGNSSIGRITPAGVVSNFTGTGINSPYGISSGPDGNVWFTNSGNSSIGRITPAGVVSNFTGIGINVPVDIAAGLDGNLWFTNFFGNSIGRITPAGVVSNFTGTGINSPGGIGAGPDGNLWFTNFFGNSIGRITPAGVVSNFTGTGMNAPSRIATGPDGNLWFTNQGNSIGRITPGGVVSNFVGVGVDTPVGIAAGPDGNMWVAASGSSAIARVSVVQPPSAPGTAVAVPGNASASVSWAPPASDGWRPVTGYTVTASPGGATCTWTGGPLNCVVSGLTNGTPYTFTVNATNSAGTGPPSVPSAAVVPVTTPGAPLSVVAVPAKKSASVSWSAPASNGGTVITQYTATSAPGGKTCTWTSGPLSCVVSGLDAGTSYTFTVQAKNAVGQGPSSAASSAVEPWDGSGYHAVTPQRILDSRGATGGWNSKLVAGAPKNLQVTGLGGASDVPAPATAVVMNVTATGSSTGSFISAWPAGTPQPASSNLNFGPGQTIPNLVTVKLGAGGKVSFANNVGSVDVVADVVGYYDDGVGAGDLFTGITPVRLLDSRTATGNWNAKLAAGTPRDLTVRQPGNPAGVPATATAVIANVTVTGGTSGSFVSVWPSGVAKPNVSNLNFGPGETIPNLAIVKIGANGAITFANAVGSVDVIVDVVGYFDPTSGSRFHAINPTRVLDDRVANGLTGPWGPGQTRSLAVAGRAATNVPAAATGLVANVTATNGSTGSFVTVFPDGVAKPNSSNLNFGPGQTIPNLVTVKLPANGSVAFFNSLGTVDLIADAVGYYANT